MVGVKVDKRSFFSDFILDKESAVADEDDLLSEVGGRNKEVISFPLHYVPQLVLFFLS